MVINVVHNNFKRFGAWHYKTNRDFYELHKSCLFKMGCTFCIVIIQVLCNKNYKCPKTPNLDTGANISDESSRTNLRKNTNLKEKSKNQKRVSIQDHTEMTENVICGQPQSYHSSIFETLNSPTTLTQNQSSNISPSFNLRTYQKSTPNRPSLPNYNCTGEISTHSTPKPIKTDTIVDVHNPPDSQSDQTFYSLC